MRWVTAAATLLAAWAATGPRPLHAQAAEDEIGLRRGATPPAAVVQDLEGRPVNLGEVVGRKPVLVEFWATWCQICAALLPRMEAAQRRYGSLVEFLVVGVGVNQTRDTMRRHIARHAMPFRFLFDANGAAVRAFEAPATGYVVVLDARGRVAYTGAGTDQDIEGAVRRVVGGR